MSLSYAGIPLPVPTAEILARIEASLPEEDLELWAWTGTGPNRIRWSIPGPTTSPFRPQLGHLYWPAGASRWAAGLFLVTDEQLAAIRAVVYSGNRYQAALLALGDGTRTIQAKMWMLPPRPVQGRPGSGSGLWLLPLVDQRYWWWTVETGQIQITSQTWAQLYATLAATLGVTLAADTVAAAYLQPSPALSCVNERLPPLLDTLAYNCGQRVVCGLDGSVYAYSLGTSQTLQAQQAARPLEVLVGGPLADAPGLLPSAIQINFARVADSSLSATPSPASATPAALGISTGPVGPAVRQFRDTALASYTSGSQTNAAECQALVNQFGRDWYGYQLGGYDIVYDGIIDYAPHGLADVIDWNYTRGMVSTRVYRGSYNDTVEDLYHRSSAGAASSPGLTVQPGQTLTVLSGGTLNLPSGSVMDIGSGGSGGAGPTFNQLSPLFFPLFYEWSYGAYGYGTPPSSGLGTNYQYPGYVYYDSPVWLCGCQFWCCYVVAPFTTDTSGWSVPDAATVYQISSTKDVNLLSIAPFNINGTAAPQLIGLYNGGGYNITLVHNDTGSPAGQRFYLPGKANIELQPNDSILLWYNTCAAQPQWVPLDMRANSGDVTSLGVLASPTTYTGAVKLEAGTGITLGNDVVNNAIIIATASPTASNVHKEYTQDKAGNGTTQATWQTIFDITDANGLHGSVAIKNSGNTNSLSYQFTLTDFYGRSTTGAPANLGPGTYSGAFCLDFTGLNGLTPPYKEVVLQIESVVAANPTTFDVHISMVGTPTGY